MVGQTAFFDWCGKAAKSDRTAEVIEHFLAKDPGATDWSSMGLVAPVDEGRPVHDLDGTARLLMVQFNERNLPGAVRDEQLGKRYTEMAEKEGRALNKKEYAQLKEDVEYELLPKAFIRRTLVPVLVYPNHIVCCTTSSAKVEKILGHLVRLAETRKVQFTFSNMETVGTVPAMLKRLASEGILHCGAEEHAIFDVGNSAVFKGSDKRTVRVKDRGVLAEEIAHVLGTGEYTVVELGMQLTVAETMVGDFTLRENWVVKGLKISDVQQAEYAQDTNDAHATYWLYAATIRTILFSLVDALNEGQDDEDEEL